MKTKRQKIRKSLLITALLLFPVTLYYFSPALIINAALNGIINGSFIVFLFLFLFSIPFGRSFCGYLCPAGGLQECVFAVNNTVPRQGIRNNIKYAIWTLWILIIILCFLNKDNGIALDFFFQTQNGISVTDMQSYIIYYGILLLIFVPSLLFGKRIFCHYFCWMAPFMVIGTGLRRRLHLPGLHIKANETDPCIQCGKCNKECPMGIDVKEGIKNKKIADAECIQCGACIDTCPKNILHYGMKEHRKEGV